MRCEKSRSLTGICRVSMPLAFSPVFLFPLQLHQAPLSSALCASWGGTFLLPWLKGKSGRLLSGRMWVRVPPGALPPWRKKLPGAFLALPPPSRGFLRVCRPGRGQAPVSLAFTAALQPDVCLPLPGNSSGEGNASARPSEVEVARASMNGVRPR